MRLTLGTDGKLRRKGRTHACAVPHQDTLLEVVEALEALVSLLRPSISLHVALPKLFDASVVPPLPLVPQ